MKIKDLQKPLPIGSIDFRIQSINKGGYATILAYKDARVDMNRLDEVLGALNWKREHINNNHNCVVSVWNNEIKEWISKEDTGSESMTEKDKGLASDSFKRACFNWGIGRELYDYPAIQIKLEKGSEWDLINNKPKQLFGLKLKEWAWFTEFTDGKLTYLACEDISGTKRFSFGENKKKRIILTEDEFNIAMKSDDKGIMATLKKYNSSTHGMTQAHKIELEKQLELIRLT